MLLMCPGCDFTLDETKWEQSPPYYENEVPRWHYVCHKCGTNFVTPVILGIERGAVLQPTPVQEALALSEVDYTEPNDTGGVPG